jgi:hypothetical protein
MSSTTLELPRGVVRSTHLPSIKIEPQTTPRLSNLPYIKIESPSTPTPKAKVEASQAPTPKIKTEPQSTPRASSHTHSHTKLALKGALKVFSHPQALTHLSAKRTLRASTMGQRSRVPLRTPRDFRHVPKPSYNKFRCRARREEIALGITPCPGEKSVPNGAVEREDRGTKTCRFHMDRKWWARRIGHMIEDGEESKEEEVGVADDGAGKMVDVPMRDAPEHRLLVQTAREVLKILSKTEEADEELKESDDEWKEPDNELYRALSASS